jgi:hypothetical protein
VQTTQHTGHDFSSFKPQEGKRYMLLLLIVDDLGYIVTVMALV